MTTYVKGNKLYKDVYTRAKGVLWRKGKDGERDFEKNVWVYVTIP